MSKSQGMDIPRFVWEFGKFAAIQVVILVICLYCFFNFPRGNDPSAWGVVKREILKKTPGPRLVLMGDSNIVLGVNSGPIAKAFPEYHPINAGLYAFLGNRIILEEIADLIQPGDVVVLSWTYEQFAKNEIQYLYYHYAVQRPQSFQHFGIEEAIWFLDGGMYLLKEATKRTRKIVLMHKREPFDSVYGPDSLNQYGDGIGHYGEPSPPGTTTTIKDLRIDPDGYAGKVIDRLNDFNARMQERGARVLFSHPPISQESYDRNAAELEELDALLRERLNFPVINHPDDQFFEPEEFYDTAYHLKEDAVFERTDKLIQDLQPYLQPTTEDKVDLNQ